jgi:endonuclease III
VLPKKECRKQAERLARHAVERYGELRNRKSRPPLNQLILSTLYHVTSVRRATRALRELKHSFVDWNEVRVSHPSEVAAALSSARWAQQGAEQVVSVLRHVYDLFNRMDLDFLAGMTPAQARSALRSLTAVPAPLIEEVLLLSLGMAVLPCSAAAARMCHRLGLLDNERLTVKNQRALENMFHERHYPSLHFFFCDVAEKLCLPEGPRCERCAFVSHCQHAG